MKKEEVMNSVEVEVMNGVQVIDQKKEYKRLNGVISNSMKNLESNYIKLAVALHEIDAGQFYILDGYKSIVEYAKEKYGIQKTTVYNYLGLVDRFGLTADSKPLYTSQQMIAMLPALRGSAEISDFTPDMSVREIKAKAKQFIPRMGKKAFSPSKPSKVSEPKDTPVQLSGEVSQTVLPALELPSGTEVNGELSNTILDMIKSLLKEGKSVSIFAL